MNPNQYDDGDEQVMMRPNVTEDPGRRRTVASNPIVNGVDPPSGGHLDMDGEVTGPRVENTSSSAPTRPDQAVAGVVGRETRGAAPGIPKAPTSASDFLQTSTGNEGGVPSDGTHPTETPLGVHAQPLGSSMSGPGYQFEEQRQPRTGDSVEYASVASSVTRRDLQRGIPAESQVPGTPLFDLHTMERLQQLHAAAPQLLGSSPVVLPPRPPSTTSSDIQAEVRRQLTDVVAVYEEESRRLRSQVESLVAENYELRVQNQFENVQNRAEGSRHWLGNQGGFPSFGWLGRGIGSIIGGATPALSRALDLGQESQQAPSAQPQRRWTSWVNPPGEEMYPIPPPPQPPRPTSDPPFGGEATRAIPAPPVPKPFVPPPPSPPPGPEVIGVTAEDRTEGFSRRDGSSVGYPQDDERSVRAAFDNGGAPETSKPDDVMNVVLKGMAQLQDVVTELSSSPKQGEKPEAIKPGVTTLPDLPLPGPESCLLFSDWIHNSRPPLSDVSDTSEELWEGILAEAGVWYSNYLKLDPLSRLVSKPVPSEHLSRPRWARVSRRIETMILAALPQAVKQEVSASRVNGLLALVCRLYVVYAPGSISERELGLRHIQEPPACSGVAETIEGLRKWKRWCVRMSELGGTLPDAALQVRALTKLTKGALQGHPDIFFRVNLVRHNLQVDVTPDQDKVHKLHAQLLSEFEMIGHRSTTARDQDRGQVVPSPPPQAKVKGVEFADTPGSGPKAPKAPKQPPKPPPPVKQGPADISSASKPPCTFYTSPTGCKKGSDCNFEHNWSSIPFEDRKGRCKNCGAKGHKSSDCKAGAKEGEPKGKGKGSAKPPPPPKAAGEASVAQATPTTPVASQDPQQQIKSMLADAALILQQAMPSRGNVSSDQQGHVPAPPASGQSGFSSAEVTPGTPVTLASLSAQIDSLRSRTHEYEAKMLRFDEDYACISTVALLDSGATHPVVPFTDGMSGLQRVPVTLAGDSREEWYRTKGGTLVVPPIEGPSSSGKPQTIIPLGALVETLGCTVSWSKRGGLKVHHPHLGLLRTGVGRNTCPFIQEDQALSLISQLEDERLKEFKEQVRDLEVKMESVSAPIDPTEALRKYATSGRRSDALRAVYSQPYFDGVAESIKARLAEDLVGLDENSGKRMLKQLPVNRAHRRSLLTSERWVVHLCSGSERGENPLKTWCQDRDMQLVEVDVVSKGGKGWDLMKSCGVWRALLWAAATGRIVSILSSPNPKLSECVVALGLQPLFLWSLASVAKGRGIPFLFETPRALEAEYTTFAGWANASLLCLDQGLVDPDYSRCMQVCTNLNLSQLCASSHSLEKGRSGTGSIWSRAFRAAVVCALEGRYTGPSCEELDQVIARALRSGSDRTQPGDQDASEVIALGEDISLPVADDLPQPDPEVTPGPSPKRQLSKKEIEAWKQHISDGHVPYRRDCRLCVEGAGIGIQHRRIAYPQSFALSVDLFGPVPKHEHGRDETCISGKTNIKYGLVGAFRVPRSMVQHSKAVSREVGVEDLFGTERENSNANPLRTSPLQEEQDTTLDQDLVEDLAEYEPSEPGEPLDDELRALLGVDEEEGLSDLQEFQPRTVAVADFESLLEPRVPTKDPEELQALIEDLKRPVNQVVLRYFVPLKTKTGQDVLEGLQRLVLDINKRYPVKILHSDPGTEFSSYALTRWAASQGIRVQHTLPTDKKANGLAERTVGWVKSRVRTLLKAASLPIHWWPLAARWAAQAHNRSVEGEQPLPSFGHYVLHRTKTPKDADRQILGRWVRYRYAAPHSSIPEGHVLITESGNLVASKGFRDKVLDPLEYDELRLPDLEAVDETLEAPLPENSGGAPHRRLRSKTAIMFVEVSSGSTSEGYSKECILKEDFSDDAFHTLMSLLLTEEGGTQDRRGDMQDRLVFGAYCHGGKRGVTKITYRRPFTAQFLNQVLVKGLCQASGLEDPRWTSLMLMRSGDVPVHRDYRNEWGSRNHVLSIPGRLLLWTDNEFEPSRKTKVVGDPDWNSSAVTTISGNTVTFDPRMPHAVRKQPEWVLVGYTPLGARKLSEEAKDYLCARGFILPDFSCEEQRVAMLRAENGELITDQEEVEPHDEEAAPSAVTPADLEQDVQPDLSTTLVGWDFSRGDPAEFPVDSLRDSDLSAFLDERGMRCELGRLNFLGVDDPEDLQYLYEEDLIEMGMPRIHAQRILFGIHPEGTRRPDNPNVSGLQTGEVRLLSREHMFIPRVIQNRTLDPSWTGGPPVQGLGVRELSPNPRDTSARASDDVGYRDQPSSSNCRPQAFACDQEEYPDCGFWEDEWVSPFEELGVYPSESSTQVPSAAALTGAYTQVPGAAALTGAEGQVTGAYTQVPSAAALTGAYTQVPGAAALTGAEGQVTGAYTQVTSAAALTGAYTQVPGAAALTGAEGQVTGAYTQFPGTAILTDARGQVTGARGQVPGAYAQETGDERRFVSLFGLEVGSINPGPYVDPLEELGVYPSESSTQVHFPSCSVGRGLLEGRSRCQVTSRSASFPRERRSRRSTVSSRSESSPATIRMVQCEEDPDGDPCRQDETSNRVRIGVPAQVGVTIAQVIQDESNVDMTSGFEFGSVKRVDESFYTSNVEDLLKGLTAPLGVVHNVSPSEVKEHIAEWIPAAKSEVEALEQMGAIIRLVGSDANAEMKAPGTQVLPAKTVFTVKPGSGGNYFRRKCRVVGCGNFESKSNDLDLYAGGIPADVLRTCLVEASSRKLSAFITDIKNAFLLAPIPQAERTRIMLRPPKILEAMNITQPGELWWVDRAVYGLRQSPRWWGEHRDAVLAEAKWPSKRYGNLCLRQSGVEGNLWKMTTTSNEIVGFVIVYVDDMMFLSTPDDAAGLHMWVKSQWECTPLEQATTSHAVTFLGVEVHVETLETGESGFALCQRAYIQELARSYGITTRGRLAPVPKDWVRELPEPEAQPSVDVIRKAQRITGEVLWVAQRSRPDISYCVSLMGSWITKVPSLVSKMGVRLIEFLFSTIDQTLSLTPKQDVGPGLRVYSDASFAPFGSKSVSGILLQFRGRNVLWKGQRQTLVCLSTAEAELVAAVEGVVLSQSLRALISEFELRLGITELYVDNTAAIVLAEGGGSTRTRHLRLRSAFIRDLIGRNEICVAHCPGDVQPADILTKILPGPRHQALSTMLGLGPPHQVARVTTDGDQIDRVRLQGLSVWLVAVLIMLQTQQGASAEEEEIERGIGPELSLIIVMMALSVLFVWEVGKYCLQWCFRAPYQVRSVRPDDQDTRRSRRQEAVRRAIAIEAEGLRRRRESSTEEELVVNSEVSAIPPPPPQVDFYPEPRSSSSAGLLRPPVPDTDREFSITRPGFGQSSVVPPPPPVRVNESTNQRCDVGIQTDEPRGITYDELHEIQVLTSTSRTPGVVHLFPGCHALRGVSTNRRHFCKYCLQAAARTGI